MNFFEILAESQRGAIQAYLPGTRAEISTGTGLPRTQVDHRLRAMKAAGEVHIGGYKRSLGTGGSFSPVFHDGPGEDMECHLKAQDNAAYSRRYRKAERNQEAMDRKRAKDRMRHWKKKAAAADPMVAAMFGRGAP